MTALAGLETTEWTKLDAFQAAEVALAENTDKAALKNLQAAVDTARAEYETAQKAAQVSRDKMDKMREQEEATMKKKRDKELATQKKDYEERKAVMATAKTTYEVKKARKAELATLKTDLAAKIAALGAGDEKTRLEYKLGQLTTEDGGIDVAALKGTYETQQGVFDAKEKELDAARTTAEGTKRENAFAGIKSAYDKLKTEKEKAETQLAVWLAKKRTSRTDEQREFKHKVT